MPSFFLRKLVMHSIPRNMRAISAYIAAVSIAGAVVLLWSVLNPGDTTFRSETTFWLFLLATMFGELRPIRSPIGQEGVEFTVSTTFAFAILLTSGLLPALLTLSLATLLADLLARKAWWKALFNSVAIHPRDSGCRSDPPPDQRHAPSLRRRRCSRSRVTSSASSRPPSSSSSSTAP